MHAMYCKTSCACIFNFYNFFLLLETSEVISSSNLSPFFHKDSGNFERLPDLYFILHSFIHSSTNKIFTRAGIVLCNDDTMLNKLFIELTIY